MHSIITRYLLEEYWARSSDCSKNHFHFINQKLKEKKEKNEFVNNYCTIKKKYLKKKWTATIYQE